MPTLDDDALQPDPLHDRQRVAAARRLLVEVPGPAAFDRLSGLAARILNAGHAKVTLFTAQDTVVGGHGLPPGIIGGPALLTGALSAIVVRQGAPLSVPDARADERVADLPAVTSGQVRAYLGSPLVAASGHVVGALTIYDPEPRQWTDDEIELLRELAASVVAELELSAARSAAGTSATRLNVALEASSIGTWEQDLRSGAIDMDERCAALYGLDGATHFESVDDMQSGFVYRDDIASLREALERAMEHNGQFTAEFRAMRVDGSLRWMVGRGRVINDSRGEPVRLLGTVIDVTDTRRQAAQRLSAMHRATAIAEVAAELANAAQLESLPEIVLRGAQVLGAQASAMAVFDAGNGPLRLHMTSALTDEVQGYVDYSVRGLEIELDDTQATQYAAMHGRRVLLADREEALARFPSMREALEVLNFRAVAALPLRVESRLLGSFVALWSTDHPFSTDDAELLEALAAQIALSVSRLQADAERDLAVAATREANRRLQVLAETGRVFSGTLDIDLQIEQLAQLVVPELGDWCWILVTDEHGRLHEVGSAHRDVSRNAELAAYVRAMVGSMTPDAAARSVTRTGTPVFYPKVEWNDVERALPDPAVREAFARLGAGSCAVVPLTARGQTLGALGLFARDERGPLSQAEVDTVIEIGRRAGLALHHARLYSQQRDLADALQRSMLTDPPAPDHSEIVVRYVPAAAGAEIGGDWYDAFLQPSGATVIAIGDVVGHDTRAAAAMGQVRGLLRGIGYSSGGSPAEVLTELDRAIEGLALETMATALVARLEQDEADLLAGRVRLRWSSAGHPPPAVLTADGRTMLLDEEPADLLLGVAPESKRREHVTVLDRGSTVLLYTDGLVERRDRDVDSGTAELVEVLQQCVGIPLDDLCDQVLKRLFLPDSEDDVAILALRLHPQDRPRPAEAGPQRVPKNIPPSPAVEPKAPSSG